MPNDARHYIAEELLEVQRTLGWMDLVIGNIKDAVCVTDANNHLIFVNECFAELVETPRVFLLGQIFQDVFPITKVAESPEEITPENKLNGSGENQGVYEWRNKNDKPVIIRVSSRQLPTTDQIVYMIQNITREYELARMKTDFIDLASHQLRTPMTAIMTYSHMLQQGYAGELNDDQLKLATTIVRSSERMIRLVNDLLLITRVQNEQDYLQYKLIDFTAVFEQIRTELLPRLTEEKLAMKIDIPSKIELESDPSVLHEIFSNLVVNAVQYTPKKGAITVTVHTKKDDVIVAIKDTGIGIPKEHQQHLYNQFSRADNALKAYPEGTGLGLYMIKILLGKIGGTIDCESELGKGTTFTVCIPKQPEKVL
ncbi:MAG: PAS domain-containing sensor histidine kinase [Patescibacteria group bacterium]|nr:PAS domain-containing sensor histidine kinase [Patescibacteria group bacterium]